MQARQTGNFRPTTKIAPHIALHNAHCWYANPALVRFASTGYILGIEAKGTSELKASIDLNTPQHFQRRSAQGQKLVDQMNFARSYANWRRYRQTCSELNRLSQRELSDLGISRADIPTIARAASR